MQCIVHKSYNVTRYVTVYLSCENFGREKFGRENIGPKILVHRNLDIWSRKFWSIATLGFGRENFGPSRPLTFGRENFGPSAIVNNFTEEFCRLIAYRMLLNFDFLARGVKTIIALVRVR